MSGRRRAALVVDAALACVFVALMATPVTWGVAHEWLGIAELVLVFAHVVLLPTWGFGAT